jgi:hypothetical protein
MTVISPCNKAPLYHIDAPGTHSSGLTAHEEIRRVLHLARELLVEAERSDQASLELGPDSRARLTATVFISRAELLLVGRGGR